MRKNDKYNILIFVDIINRHNKGGSFMAKVDNMMREHIAAAKKWLGKAETSLNNENNIRGDIHLMLAEAELKRAKEKSKQTFILSVKQWGIILPVIACLFAVAIYLLPVKNNQGKTVITKSAATAAINKVGAEPAESTTSQPVMAKVENVQLIKQETKATAAIATNKLVIIKTDRAVASEKELKTNPSVSSNVPSKEMQQLMRTAKKTLQE